MSTPLTAGELGVARRNLSKSKLMAFRQCHRRLWLEVHHPELRDDSDAAKSRFEAGYRVGEVARRIYDPKGRGVEIDPRVEGYAQALDRTRALLETRQPIFEAGFAASGGIAFADVMLPVTRKGQPAWRMVEVKSSASIKDYQREDVAVQAHVARAGGANLAAVAVAHVDTSWVYPGEGRYEGLLKEQDLSKEAFARGGEVQSWIDGAQAGVAQASEPGIDPGRHCATPFECGFIAHCSRDRGLGRIPRGMAATRANQGPEGASGTARHRRYARRPGRAAEREATAGQDTDAGRHCLVRSGWSGKATAAPQGTLVLSGLRNHPVRSTGVAGHPPVPATAVSIQFAPTVAAWCPRAPRLS